MTISRGQEFALGFLYWLTFLLVPEPGNIARAGGTLAWDDEAVRILGASLLGASSTPILMTLMRRFPIEGGKLWLHAAIHSFGSAGLSFALIAISCVLAAWLKIGDSRPFLDALPDHLTANWLLLAFCIASFVAIAHAVRFFQRAEDSRLVIAQLQAASLQDPHTIAVPPVFLTNVQVKSRGRTILVDMASVDWIETQGNYLALHAGSAVHLLRETMAKFESKLNPKHFTRIHRRTLVAVDRIREMSTLANGDAVVRLTDGTDLRLSRGFRETVRAAWEQQKFGAASRA